MRYETKLLLKTREILNPLLVRNNVILIDQDITGSEKLISSYISWLEDWNEVIIVKAKRDSNLELFCAQGKFDLLNPGYDLNLKKLKIIY